MQELYVSQLIERHPYLWFWKQDCSQFFSSANKNISAWLLFFLHLSIHLSKETSQKAMTKVLCSKQGDQDWMMTLWAIHESDLQALLKTDKRLEWWRWWCTKSDDSTQNMKSENETSTSALVLPAMRFVEAAALMNMESRETQSKRHLFFPCFSLSRPKF